MESCLLPHSAGPSITRRTWNPHATALRRPESRIRNSSGTSSNRTSLFSSRSPSFLGAPLRAPSPAPPSSRSFSLQIQASASAAASVAGGDASYAPEPEKTQNLLIPCKPSFVDHFRAVAFYITTLLIAIPLFAVMLAIQPFVFLFDRLRRRAQHRVNDIWANISTSIYYKTEVIGEENLPPPDAPAVYVANHQSQLDIYTLFQLHRPFKFISKTSNFLIPIVGWSMYLTGHVPLARADKRSQMECLKQCLSLLQSGVPVLFFPEGTRTKDGTLSSFKKGAFSIAAKAGVPVVPITLLGTGTLMPNGEEGTLYATDVLWRIFGKKSVRVVVHEPLVGTDADELCKEARQVIAKTLKENGLPVGSE